MSSTAFRLDGLQGLVQELDPWTRVDLELDLLDLLRAGRCAVTTYVSVSRYSPPHRSTRHVTVYTDFSLFIYN